MLRRYAEGNLSNDEIAHFCTLIDSFYSNISEGDRITTENMTNEEREIAEITTETLRNLWVLPFTGINAPDPVMFRGMVAFRCELLPVILSGSNVSSYGTTAIFQRQVEMEHDYLHEENPDCDFLYADDLEHCRCRSISDETVQHSSIYFEYELTD